MGLRHTSASGHMAWPLRCVTVLVACLLVAVTPAGAEASAAGLASEATETDRGTVSESLTRTIALKDGDHLVVCNEEATLSMTDDIDGSGHLLARRVSRGLFDDTITYTAGTLVLHAVSVSGEYASGWTFNETVRLELDYEGKDKN